MVLYLRSLHARVKVSSRSLHGGPLMEWRPFKLTSGGEGSHSQKVEARWSLYELWILLPFYLFTALGAAEYDDLVSPDLVLRFWSLSREGGHTRAPGRKGGWPGYRSERQLCVYSYTPRSILSGSAHVGWYRPLATANQGRPVGYVIGLRGGGWTPLLLTAGNLNRWW